MKKLNLPAKTILRVINSCEVNRYKEGFEVLKQNNIDIIVNRPNISDRVKAKYLLSLDKFEK